MVDEQFKAEKIKCPKCGATDITLNSETGMLVCDYCFTTFKSDSEVDSSITNKIEDIANVTGEHYSKGLSTTAEPNYDITSFKCPSCKAEIGVEKDRDVATLTCHWCRHQISIADKITNGVTPDAVISFEVSKEQALTNINKALKKKKFYADPTFSSTLNLENIKPVYLPYILADINSQNKITATGGITKKKWTVKKGNKSTTHYKVDLYDIVRDFKCSVDNLLVEANKNYFVTLGDDVNINSKNVISNIKPFDVSKAQPYTPAFFNGDFRVEFKDTDVELVKQKILAMANDIAYITAETDTCKEYTHGVKSGEKNIDVIGSTFSYVLAPVWLYSYCNSDGVMSYIAVNGQTGETSSCVPVNKKKLLIVTAIIEALGLLGVVIL